MIDDLELLYLQSPVGKGQENNPEDVEALDDRLRRIKAYIPPAEYLESAQRYATEPMIGALERYQEEKGLKVDGIANPGGPTERAINNELLEKPRGAGLLYDPPTALAGTVGNGFENRREDVAAVKRALGALGYLPEDPFDKPHGFIDEAATNGVKAFQRAKGLTDDGWLAPNGETERALEEAVADLKRARGREWLRFADRAANLERGTAMRTAYLPADTSLPQDDEDTGEDEGITLTKVLPRPVPTPGSPGRGIPGPRQLEPRGLIEVDPRFAPPPRLRWSEPMPRDQEFRNPGERPNGPPLRLPRFDRLPKPEERLSIEDVPRALGRPSKPRLDDEVERALPIVPLRREPDVYVPEPGSPLRIPIIDFNPFGPRGKPETQQATKDVVDAIEAACKKALEGTSAKFDRDTEKYYEGPNGRRGSSFADGLYRIKIGNITIDFVADTYTPKADASPDSGEERRFLKLRPNMKRAEVHGFVIRVPKPWALGQVLDTEKLSEATKKLCEQIRKMLDNGELSPDKEKVFVPKLLNELTKAKPKPDPSNEGVPRE